MSIKIETVGDQYQCVEREMLIEQKSHPQYDKLLSQLFE